MAEALAPEDLPGSLVSLIGPYLSRQRWYAGEGAPRSLAIVSSGRASQSQALCTSLFWAIVKADGSEYQLVIAARPGPDGAEVTLGREEAFLGNLDGWAYYDATVDPDMSLVLLDVASGGSEHARRARPLVAEQSNSSIIYDDRLILKVFRRLSLGANPDVEVTSALAATGFRHVAQPLVRWQREGRDLAFGQRYLAGGTDGWALALTSLRDYYGTADADKLVHPALSGGDFAAEAARLGHMTGQMNLAMAEAYPTTDELARSWPEFVSGLQTQVELLGPALSAPARPLFQRLRAVHHPGRSVRAHGDFHLGQVMRTDSGWYVLDFEGEPNRPMEERLRPTSVMKDVAGMLRSFQYASRFALGERAEAGPASALEPLAEAWEERNTAAFMHGYYESNGIEELLPPAAQDREAVRVAFELEKALYELAYEKSFRPAWAPIPFAALLRLLTRPLEVLLAPPAPPMGAAELTEKTDA